jgi:hypothetical protein
MAKRPAESHHDQSGEIMTQINTGSLDGAASASTPNECTAVNTDTAPKLDLRRESDRRQDASPIASDVPRRARKLRVVATIAALLAVLGIGWGAGLKTNEIGNLGQVSTWFQDTAGALVSYLDTQRKKIIASIEGLASASASQATMSPDRFPNEIKTAEVIERSANGLGIKLDLLRVSSATVISELGRGFEHVNGSVERSQRELLAKLDQLQERLERLERHFSGASSTGQAQPPGQSAATKNVPLPLQASAPAIAGEAPKPTTAPTQIKRIENWAVREVVDGIAILAGPRGIIGVSSGDVVPGVGRVESISRHGRRWVVATSKGVITGP